MSVLPRAVPLAPLTLALLWGCAPKVPPDTAQDSRPDSTETGETGAPLAPRLLVSGYKSGAVLVLDPTTGTVVTTLPGLPGAQATRVHPDGRLLLVAEEVPGVYVADATTFEGLAPLIWNDPGTEADETGGLTSPTGVAFLANGELVVGDYKTDRILRFDAQGAYLGVFAEGVEGLDGPDAGLVVGPRAICGCRVLSRTSSCAWTPPGPWWSVSRAPQTPGTSGLTLRARCGRRAGAAGRSCAATAAPSPPWSARGRRRALWWSPTARRSG